jgi:hypothetical protein
MPSIGRTWVLASIGAVVEMGILSTLKRLLMESTLIIAMANACAAHYVTDLGRPRPDAALAHAVSW